MTRKETEEKEHLINTSKRQKRDAKMTYKKREDKYHLSEKEMSFLLKKNLVELIYNTGKFEGLNTTLLQTEEIVKHNQANDVAVDDVLTVVNLKKGYESILVAKNISYFDFSKQANGIVAKEDALYPSEIRTGGVTVTTFDTSYVPDVPVENEVKNRFKSILNDGSVSQTERALNLFLYMTKNQIFWDGNKRTATVTVNKFMYDNGLGVLTIPQKEFKAFNVLLSQYYHDGSYAEALKEFIYDRCIFGIDYK